MDNVWTALLPLIVGSALVPVQLLITILLIANSRIAALAWVGGATTVRAVQGVLFGLVLSSGDVSDPSGGPSPIASTLLLVVGALFLVTAARNLVGEDDPDAPPPRWMATIDGLSTGRAFLLGAGAVLVGAKFWVFTLSAIAVVAEADLGQPNSAVAFVVFVVLASSVQLVMIGAAYVAPQRAETTLRGLSTWLTAHNRQLMVAIGTIFGTWFLVKALDGFGIL
jgi:Sap, sulfolipid-1-addressing protein